MLLCNDATQKRWMAKEGSRGRSDSYILSYIEVCMNTIQKSCMAIESTYDEIGPWYTTLFPQFERCRYKKIGFLLAETCILPIASIGY